MKSRWVTIAALVLAAFACLPAGAGAKARSDRLPRQRWLDFELRSSDGYSIHATVNPRRRLILHVTKEAQATHERFTAEYTTYDTLAGIGRLKANLLGLGSIAVRFHPRGAVRHPSLPRCGPERPTVQPGVVRGTIEFAGEGGYTQIKAHEADAAIEEPVFWYCRYGSDVEPNLRADDWTSEFSAWGEGDDFLARKYRPGTIEGGQVLYLAETGETSESVSSARSRPVRLLIRRRLEVSAPASTFDDAHPEHLTVAPPPPFSGSAALARTPESVFTREGDLAVRFPGFEPAPLAGPGFASGYCSRETGCFEQNLRSPGPAG